MSTLVARPALVVAAIGALAGVGHVAGAALWAGADQVDPAEQLVIDARRVAEQHDFAGVLEVTWSDADGSHSREVAVRSSSGVLALGDEGQVVVEGPRRFLHGTEG